MSEAGSEATHTCIHIAWASCYDFIGPAQVGSLLTASTARENKVWKIIKILTYSLQCSGINYM